MPHRIEILENIIERLVDVLHHAEDPEEQQRLIELIVEFERILTRMRVDLKNKASSKNKK